MCIYSVRNNFKYFNVISSLLLISSVLVFRSAVYTSLSYTKYLQYTFVLPPVVQGISLEPPKSN